MKARLDRGDDLHLVDVREAEELALCSLEGAQHIPMLQLFSGMATPDVASERDIVVFCHHGIRSLESPAAWGDLHDQLCERHATQALDAAVRRDGDAEAEPISATLNEVVQAPPDTDASPTTVEVALGSPGGIGASDDPPTRPCPTCENVVIGADQVVCSRCADQPRLARDIRGFNPDRDL